MAFFQTVQDFVTWKKQGKLPAFKPEGFDQIMPNFRDENSSYMALRVNALTYAYNISKVRAEDAPKSAQDFLKPMFAGNNAFEVHFASSRIQTGPILEMLAVEDARSLFPASDKMDCNMRFRSGESDSA
jgi:ABC-type Fe3+ transport system substrate-binding protein